MVDGGPSILEELPSRPLTPEEGMELVAQESDSSYVRPESYILREDGSVVVALMAVDRDADHCWLIGYSPEESGWGSVDDWEYDDIEHDSFYARLDEWEAETFVGRDGWMLG